MILADTGFWLALAHRGDAHFGAAREAMRVHAAEGFVSTWPVLTEAIYLITKRVSGIAARHFLRDVCAGVCSIHPLPDDALPRMLALMQRYENLPMDLADASLVLLAEELNEGRILSTDTRDFGAYRFKNRKPFKNLLLKI